jgi:hypothetical protein
MELKDIRVFVCVPGVGKTYLAKQDSRFIDLDEMKARYKYGEENVSSLEIEKAKGNRGKALRDDSTEYIEKQMLYYYNETDKILLFAPNHKMVDLICKHNIPYCLVYHNIDCVDELRERMIKRGNTENFINSMLDPIERFYKENSEDTRPACKIELQKGEYLSDKLMNL